MPQRPLKPEEIAGLLALYYACGGSTKAHVPIEFFRRRLREPYRREARRIIKKLRRRGFVHVHPGRTESYGITKEGIRVLKEMKLI